MKTKDNSVILNLSIHIESKLDTIDRIYLKYGRECVITSGKDGKHRKGSKHNSEPGNTEPAEAIDTRTFYFSRITQRKVTGEIQSALGDLYDVVLEHNHIHIEYDPT